jgi:hypothetical protein
MSLFKHVAGKIIEAFFPPLPQKFLWLQLYPVNSHPPIPIQGQLKVKEDWTCASGQRFQYFGCRFFFYSASFPILRQTDPLPRRTAALGIKANWWKSYGFFLLVTTHPSTTHKVLSEHCWRRLGAHGGQTECKEIATWLVKQNGLKYLGVWVQKQQQILV